MTVPSTLCHRFSHLLSSSHTRISRNISLRIGSHFQPYTQTPNGSGPDPLNASPPMKAQNWSTGLGRGDIALTVVNMGFFLAKKVRGQEMQTEDIEGSNSIGFRWEVSTLGSFEEGFFNDIPEEDRYVAFADPSTYAEGPGWPLRNLLVLIRQRFRASRAKILCYRDTWARRHEARSVVLPIEMDPVETTEMGEMPKVTGWERSRNGKLQAQQANLADYMDPTRLADSSVDLNLKLMKWRLAPDLDLDLIKNTKCLLLGAGTLGGYVSRNLLGWGVRKVTFVDYGRVSYSNPVRQPLFEFSDCTNGGQPKAAAAAAMLKRIYPGVESEGHALSVPMLGHAFTDEEKTRTDLERLEGLIEDHDVIFLLMDTRESRWLPTVIGKAREKIVMNAALGFDSYVVMRHGAETREKGQTSLGCYFCNDVVAPADVSLLRLFITRPPAPPSLAPHFHWARLSDIYDMTVNEGPDPRPAMYGNPARRRSHRICPPG
ncbi:Autophagy protein 7 [Metarhizium acridum]|nr:Autophagy protein 7 [Metarhizium acridum]